MSLNFWCMDIGHKINQTASVFWANQIDLYCININGNKYNNISGIDSKKTLSVGSNPSL